MNAPVLSTSVATVVAFNGATADEIRKAPHVILVPPGCAQSASRLLRNMLVVEADTEQPGQGALSACDLPPDKSVTLLGQDYDWFARIGAVLHARGLSVKVLEPATHSATAGIVSNMTHKHFRAVLENLEARVAAGRLNMRREIDRATDWTPPGGVLIAKPEKAVEPHGSALATEAPPLSDTPVKATLCEPNHARRWIANGFAGQLLTTQPGSKVTHVPEWGKRRQSDDAIIADVENGHGLGLLMGLDFVAFDVEDTEFAPDILALLVNRLGQGAPVRSRQGSQSCAVILRTSADSGPTPSSKISIRVAAQPKPLLVFEVVAINNNEKTPRYLHVEGTRDDAGGVPVEWTHEPVAAELPILSRAEIDTMREEVADLIRAKSPDAELTIKAGDDAGTSKRDCGPSAWAGASVLDDLTPLLSALLLIENGAWCDYDEWKRGAFAFASLSAGDPEVLTAFQGWQFPPGSGSKDSAPEIFEKGRNGALATPPGPAAGIVAGWLRQHPLPGREAAARRLADEIVAAVGERTRTPASEDFGAFPAALPDGLQPDGNAARTEDNGPWALWRAKLAKIRAARIEAGQDQANANGGQGFSIFGPGGEAIAKAKIEVRPDITPTHARGEVSVLAAASGAGKSSLSVLVACAIAWERPDVIGLDKIDWPGDVLIFSNEDRDKAFARKLKAVALHHGLQDEDQKHRIVVKHGRVLLLQKTQRGGFEPTPEFLEVLDWIASHRTKHGIALVVIDTLASAQAGGDENSNNDMQQLMSAVADIADAAFCSVELIHHNRKGDDGSLTAVRGASAIGGAARSNSGLTKASAEDAKRYGWTDAERDAHVWWAGLQANDRTKLGRVLFKFVVRALPAADPRDPERMCDQDVPILTHVPPPKVASLTLDEAFEKIKAELDAGRKVRRGGNTGREVDDMASAIVGESGFIARRDANALVDTLVEAGRLVVASEWQGKNRVEFLALPAPGSAAVSGEKT